MEVMLMFKSLVVSMLLACTQLSYAQQWKLESPPELSRAVWHTVLGEQPLASRNDAVRDVSLAEQMTVEAVVLKMNNNPALHLYIYGPADTVGWSKNSSISLYLNVSAGWVRANQMRSEFAARVNPLRLHLVSNPKSDNRRVILALFQDDLATGMIGRMGQFEADRLTLKQAVEDNMHAIQDERRERIEADSLHDETLWDHEDRITALEKRGPHYSMALGMRSILTRQYSFTVPAVEFIASSSNIGFGYGVKTYAGMTPWTSTPLDGLGPRRDVVLGGELFVRTNLADNRFFFTTSTGYAYGAELFVKRGKVASGQLKRAGVFTDGFPVSISFEYNVSKKVSVHAGGSYLVGADLAVLQRDGRSYQNNSTNAFMIGGGMKINLN